MSIDWIPARKITPKEKGNRRIIPTSKIFGRIAEYESFIERNFYFLLFNLN